MYDEASEQRKTIGPASPQARHAAKMVRAE